ncbi:MAG: oligosaccharide flippase family protein [Flavobacteriia bacterium]|nr:oligosaccharide flippase family protein [Flavobacteriia bacterium]
MQKKFISNLFLMLVLNLLIKPIAIFGIDATVQNKVGAENYGIYFSLLNLSFLFNILLDLGINNFTTKNIAQYPHIVTRYMGKLLSFRLLLFVIYACITIIIAFILGYKKVEFGLLIFFIFNQFLTTIIAYFRSHFSGLLLFKTESIISVLDRFLLIVFCGFVFIYSKNEFKIEWFVWIQTFCYFIVALLAFFLLVKEIGMPKFTWHWTFSKAIVKKSIPYALLIILMMFYTRIDSVMIERIHPNGQEQAGIYAQGFRLLDACFLFGMIFSNLLFPLFSHILKMRESILPLLTTAGNLLIGGSIVIAIFCYFNSEYILSLIYKNDIQQTIGSFQWLMLSFIGMCFSLIFGTLLTANGSLKFLNISSFFGIIMNVGLNFYLIPLYGATGAAFATFCTQTTIAIIQFLYCASNFKFHFSFQLIGRYLLFLGLIVLMHTYLSSSKTTVYMLVLELFLSVAVLMATKMIDIRSLKNQFIK